MSTCPKCHDTKYVQAEDGNLKPCSCLIKSQIKAYLPTYFDKYPIVKKFNHKDFTRNLVCKGSLSKFGSLINTYLTHRYLLSNEYTYSISTAHAFVEQFFEPESQIFYDSDLFILLVTGGYKNQRSQDKLSAIVKDRLLTGKQTIIFIDSTEFPESKLKDWYGSDFIESIKSFSVVN